MRAAYGWSSRSPGQKPGVETLAPSRRSAASVSIRGATVFEVDRGVSDPWYTRPDSKLIEVPVFGAGTACAMASTAVFKGPDPRRRLQYPANGSIVMDQNTCPRSTGFGSSSPIYIVVRL